jgi:hypothetical protein
LSDFIQIQGKIVVHFLNKGGWYLREDLQGEERGREWLEGRIAGADDFLERGEEKEEMRRERRREEEEAPMKPV